MTQGNDLRQFWKVKMTGICELLNVEDREIFEKTERYIFILKGILNNCPQSCFW